VDEETYIREGFNTNSLIYGAIMFKARAALVAPLRAYMGDADHPDRAPADHPLSRLMLRPNKFQSSAEFNQVNVVYLNVTGNCYLHLDRRARGEFPQAIRSLRPDRVWIIPGKGELTGYIYVPEGSTPRSKVNVTDKDIVPILPEDIIHVKMPNPGDPLEGLGYGLSPLSSLAYCADVDNDVTRFLKLFFQRGTMGNTVLTFDEPMDDDDIAQARRRWQEVYGGYENWSEVAVLDQGGKVSRLGMTFDEMGFGELDERSESRILGPLGVPVILLGTRIGLKRGSYDNYETARRAFWQDTFVPELQLFQSEFDSVLIHPDGAYVKYDLSRVPALMQDKPRLVEAAYRLWSMGASADDALQIVGLDVKPIPGGNVGYLPQTIIPVDSPARGAMPTIPTAPPVGEATGEDERANSQGTAAETANDVRKEILYLMDEAKRRGLRNKSTVHFGKVLRDITDIMTKAEAEGWNADQVKARIEAL
jgi:HK97 family phage portal protein